MALRVQKAIIKVKVLGNRNQSILHGKRVQLEQNHLHRKHVLCEGAADYGSRDKKPPLRAPRCKHVCPRAATAPAGYCPYGLLPLRATAPASGTGLSYGLLPLRATLASLAGFCPCERRRPPLRAAAPVSGAGLPCGLALVAVGRPLAGGLGRGLAVGGRPCIGVGRGWPPLLLASFTTKIQQERVERFYVIQSHHT
ncbi:hypothetical protein GW17_00014889 [Ensete ventricosum]|nr:hypothetical protein GW17_00014889 [Ensete ventricosum]